jgi:hypothetical protein
MLNKALGLILQWCTTESCMHRAGLSETRSHPPLQILLKPTTKNAGSPTAWCIQHVIASANFYPHTLSLCLMQYLTLLSS